MNFLVLPLYRRADAMQEEEREIEKKLHDGIAHIKKTFKGDERMMMLQTYYRQNNYKPVYALKSASSILLQIPFFIAAYRFLSNLSSLNGTSFGLINDLSQPDGLLRAFGITVNILPIIMTAINLATAAIYSKDFPVKTKVQLLVTAGFFLVFLYNSPSGLVFYWTLNNAFSFVKTIILKTKEPKKSTVLLFSLSGIILLIIGLINKNAIGETYFSLVFVASVLIQLPLLIFRLKKIKEKNAELNKKKRTKDVKPNKNLFVICCAFMSVMTGLYIPSNVIVSSPQEFVFSSYYLNPVWYIVSAFCIAFGTFIIWCGVFYYFADDAKKTKYEKLMLIACVWSIVNFMAFGKNIGTINFSLTYIMGFYFTREEAILNTFIMIMIAVFMILLLLLKKSRKYISSILIVSIISLVCIVGYNVYNITDSVSKMDSSDSSDSFEINLSKTEENVVFIMLDRAMGEYIPYLINEKPELKEMFDGFTYYSNIVSFGRSTSFASSALFGGYEYTPTNMNTDSSRLLKDKHNEALLVMPVSFMNEGYHVTVCNPKFSNFSYSTDLSIYSDYSGIDAYSVSGDFLDSDLFMQSMNCNKTNFFVFSVMKSSPLILQPYLYEYGSYNNSYGKQIITDKYTANGSDINFLIHYSLLENLTEITQTDSSKGEFLFFTNDVTHEPQLLQTPDYSVSEHVDNENYYESNSEKYIIDGRELKFDYYFQMSSYQTNMAALLKLGEWLDYLRENDVYDNTKIIIASDHGFGICQLDDLILTDDFVIDAYNLTDAENYYPLLLVKDFNATGFNVSDEFMTNADVPSIALEGITDNPVNPFTGNAINSDEKYAHDQYIISSSDVRFHPDITQHYPANWYTVHDNIWDKNNWTLVAENAILTEEDVD